MLLFQSRPGAVVALEDPAAQCSVQLLGLKNDDGQPAAGVSFETERSIVTRLTIGQQVNLQFLHSLGDLIHVYVFGDRMGSVGLSGLAFACACPDGSDLGAEQMLAWYKRNRASRRKDPLKIAIGRTVIEGFVTGFTEDVVDPSLGLVQWGASLAALPDDD
jgi:hypothetical protein